MRNDNNLTDSSRKRQRKSGHRTPQTKRKNVLGRVSERHIDLESMREKAADKNEEMNVYVTEKA